jgi:hypothetical protein
MPSFTDAGSPVISAPAAAEPEAAADPDAPDDAAAEPATLLAALELLDDELLPDEQAASARAPAISPAMSFRLRARRTLISSSALHVAPVGPESHWHGLPSGRNHRDVTAR